MACSAKDLSNVSEVFHYAQKAVLHPSSPLFNYEINELTITAMRALHRIFKLCDLDNDGFLSDNVINYLQVKTFGAPLDKINLIEIKQLIDYNCVDGLCHDCSTESGFVYLNNLFIQQGRIETTWTILRSFGYADDLSLRSDLVQPQFTMQSGCSVELLTVGIQFLTSLFQKHDKDHDGALSPQELVDLFDVCPHSNPWGMDVLHSVTANSKDWIDLVEFLCQWIMTAYLDTPAFWNISPTFATCNPTSIQFSKIHIIVLIYVLLLLYSCWQVLTEQEKNDQGNVLSQRGGVSQYIREAYVHKGRKGHPQIAWKLQETVSIL